MFDLVPSAEDHRDSGFRAIIKGLKLPPKPRILDVGAGGFAGETTTVHLLELAGGEIDAVEINAERASALQKKFGKAINVINRGFGEFVAEAHYDLIVFDLDSNMTATQYTKFLAPASKMLRPGGKVISNIFYDSALAFDANSKLLNPSNRTAYEIFMREYFGVLKLEREVAAGRLRREGFATLGLVDKWMGTGRANAIGWLVLEKIA